MASKVFRSTIVISVGLLLTRLCGQSTYADSTLAQAFLQGAGAEHRGFRFSSGSCELGPDFCAVSVPKEWIPSELELVRGALDEIAVDPLGARVLERALSNGYRTVRRFSRAARQNVDAGSVRGDAADCGDGPQRLRDQVDRCQRPFLSPDGCARCIQRHPWLQADD